MHLNCLNIFIHKPNNICVYIKETDWANAYNNSFCLQFTIIALIWHKQFYFVAKPLESYLVLYQGYILTKKKKIICISSDYFKYSLAIRVAISNKLRIIYWSRSTQKKQSVDNFFLKKKPNLYVQVTRLMCRMLDARSVLVVLEIFHGASSNLCLHLKRLSSCVITHVLALVILQI